LAVKITKNLDSLARFAYQDAMIRRCLSGLVVALVLIITLGLMWGPMRDETATTDETVFLGAGYSYWQGHRYYLNVEHPPLMQLWSALPLQFFKVNSPTNTVAYFAGTTFSNLTYSWRYHREPDENLPPDLKPFYHYPAVEAGMFGRQLVYGAQNDADKLLFWGRFMQALVTLATGWLVFRWAKSLSNSAGGLLAMAAWCFNPLALAYGHLIITDPGIALMLPWAVWMFSRFLETPRLRTALLAGIAFAAALLTKYTAIILFPIFFVLALVAWWMQKGSARPQSTRNIFGNTFLFLAVTWGIVLLLYIPHWSPPPLISTEDANRLQVPGWFMSFRLALIPRDFFKGFTIMLVHVFSGHKAYLLGEWSQKGWWYYYPVAILVKTPVALLLLFVSALALALNRIRQSNFAEATPWIATAIYLACAMTSKADIGIRHILPIYPLLAVAVGTEFSRVKARHRLIAWILAAWLMITAFRARCDYIAYFNEFVGGSANGQNYLLDSNFDWGQDGKLLKKWTEKNHLTHIYLDYFGTGMAIEYLRIPNERIKPAEAQQLHDSYLVVSATHLMSPDYDSFRATHTPMGRIGYTLFVYSLAEPPSRPPG
jgi:dolichyl-phosphate-mannose-protein mannosyltransferase